MELVFIPVLLVLLVLLLLMLASLAPLARRVDGEVVVLRIILDGVRH